MSDEELDALVASASLARPRDIAALVRAVSVGDLTKEVLSMVESTPLEVAGESRTGAGPSGPSPVPSVLDVASLDGPSNSTGPGRRRRHRVLAVAASAVLVTGAVVGSRQISDSGGTPVQAGAGSSADFELPPRPPGAPTGTAVPILVDLPGWHVDSLTQFAIDRGQVGFTDGQRKLLVRWVPASMYEEYLGHQAGAPWDVQADVPVPGGGTARAVGAPGDPSAGVPKDWWSTQVLWLLGDTTVEAIGEFASFEEFRTVVAGLRLVDVDTWLAALPPSFIRDDDDPATIDQELAGVPRPPAFRPSSAATGLAQDPYTAVFDLFGSLACGWIDVWFNSLEADDRITAQHAVDVLAMSKDWASLQAVVGQGAFPSMFASDAQQLQSFQDGKGDAPYSSPADARNALRAGYGCDKGIDSSSSSDADQGISTDGQS
jgi:hypothetical protein